MKFTVVAKVSDVPVGQMISAILGNEDILIANIENEFFAIQRKCPHFGADLCAGKLEEGIVTCPKHGAKFDVTTGYATGKAAVAFLKFNVKNCQTYTVKKDGKNLLVAEG